MKSVTPFLLLPFLAMACQDEGPTNPLDGPELHQLADKPDKPDTRTVHTKIVGPGSTLRSTRMGLWWVSGGSRGFLLAPVAV